MEVLEALIDLGADMNAGDMNGESVLHHCFWMQDDNQYVFNMAVKLVQARANINLQARA